MHILILASSTDSAEAMQVALGDTTDRCTVVIDWADVVGSLEKDHPNLIVVERAALVQVELATLLKLAEPGGWPPLLIVDALAADGKCGIATARRLAQPPPQYYQIGDLRIDTRKRRASLGERWITLPPIQYRLLLALAQREGEVVDCQELLRLVWGYDAEEAEARELVKVHIRQIRRRLGLNPEQHNYIHSVRGFGYMLAQPEENEEK
ncbi:MAG: winged helix-turn-helix domain-containing protein [Anaerolineae bacterium]|jgi:DNA-binding winged helix-turn-helix (wHTH) protein